MTKRESFDLLPCLLLMGLLQTRMLLASALRPNGCKNVRTEAAAFTHHEWEPVECMVVVRTSAQRTLRTPDRKRVACTVRSHC